jgi:glucose-6-phosphate 1-dehydrogenase
MERNPLVRPSVGAPVVVLPNNPFSEGLDLRRVAEPSTVVVFGVTGDLSRRKLLPSLYVMHQQGALPAGFSLVGFGRRPWSDGEFRTYVRDTLTESLGRAPESDTWSGFEQALFFAPGEFDEQSAYEGLGSAMGLIDGRRARTGNRLFYLAAPPNSYPLIIDGLGHAGLGGRDRSVSSTGDGNSSGWARIVVEKPFGRDLATATRLNLQLREWFDEDQIFRIDHYLGKETVQNILVFRLANGIFEPVWDRRSVDHVQITVAEDLGVGARVPYFEQTGEMRDMVQNHALQLLALVAMEPPLSLDPDAVRDERAKALEALRPVEGADVDVEVVRGQYTAGFIAGEAVSGYRDEPGVAADSRTETFVALRVLIDNWRWAGVPFYIRAGKRMPRQATEIAIQFKQPPVLLFGKSSAQEPEPNVLAMQIQPDEGITLKVGSKVPGPAMDVQSVHMDFRYGSSFGRRSPEAYERLLLDALLGDSTLFSRKDTVDAAWRFVDRIRERWEQASAAPPRPYEAGDWGPPEASELMARDGRRWRRP